MIVEPGTYVRTKWSANATNIAVGSGEKLSVDPWKGQMKRDLYDTYSVGEFFLAAVVGLHPTLLHSWLSATQTQSGAHQEKYENAQQQLEK